MTTINAYLNFNGNTAEAMTYYKDCLGGDLVIQKISESPVANQCPAAMQNQVLHSSLTKNGVLLVMGSDMTGPEGILTGNNVALSVNCSSEEEINTFFSKFAVDGKVIDELKMQFWGALFGVLTDKFGIRWMFNYDKNQKQ